MKESYQYIQSDLHGEDHKLQAVQRAQEQATHGGAPSVGARLAEERKKAVRPSSRPLTRERELRSMSINRTLTAQEMDEDIPSGTAVGRFPRRSATRDSPDLHPTEDDGRPEEYAMHTPRGTHAVKLTSPDSPDHLLFSEEAMDIWRNNEAVDTEDTEEMNERLQDLCAGLGVHPEARAESIEFIVRIEQLTPEYRMKFGRWLAYTQTTVQGLPWGRSPRKQPGS